MSSKIIRITSCHLYDLLLIVLLLFTPGYTEQQDSSYPKLKSVQIVSEDIFLSSRIDTINC